MKKNNKGFSLVELIIIIAIMAVVGVSVVSYIGMLGRSEARKCAKELSTSISQTKVCAMSRSNASMTVYADDTGVYVKSVEGSSSKTEKIGNKGVSVSYLNVRGGSSYIPVGQTEADGVKIEFDRASGACKKLSSGNYCYGFKITSGKTTFIIEIEPLTGKTSIK